MKPRLSWTELEHRCQKPDWQRQGNWMARHIARPLALRITRIAIPCGISAHLATATAWAVALGGAGCLASGRLSGAVAGICLWQLWYLLDHVDGQLARFHGTASLDGVQLDYLMHHSLNLTMPLALGCGLGLARQSLVWMLLGFVASWATTLLGLLDDTRYKAHYQRLKRLRGELLIRGGAALPATPAATQPRTLALFCRRLCRKLCEVQVQMNLWSAVVVSEFLGLGANRSLSAALLSLTAATATIALAGSLIRSQRREAAETDFARWYRPAEGNGLELRDGYWHVVPLAVPAEVPPDSSASNPASCSAPPGEPKLDAIAD